MVGMFMLGPLELIIVLGMVAVLVTIVVIVIATTRRVNPPSSGNANLAPCPDCGRMISLRATTCPHCGGPVQFK